MPFIDLTGQKFNRLTALDIAEKRDSRNAIYWRCQCDCGKETVVRGSTLKCGDIKSCGCALALDLTKQTFHLLEVIERDYGRTNRRGQAYWRCRCECGNETSTTTIRLTSGETKSCGCLKYRKGQSHPGYTGCGELDGNFWNRIQLSAKMRGHELSLTVDEAWGIFQRQIGLCALTGMALSMDRKGRTASLDRIDSSKGYTPDNVQWVHKDINMMKRAHSTERFVELCKAVVKHAETFVCKS